MIIGLLQKATTAKEENEQAKEFEKIQLAVSSAQLTETGFLTTDNLNNEFKSIFNNNEEVKETKNGWRYKTSKKAYIIHKNGKIEEADLLPDDYYRVEYIETKGTEYIDTEYIFKNKPKIVGEIMITSGGDLDIMGNINAKEGCFIINFLINNNLLYYRYSSANRIDINTGIEINKWNNFEFSDKIKVNGLEKGTIGSYNFSNNNQTFYIGRGRNCGCARFKEIKMYDGENLVRHFIPCYRKSDEKGGMFDVVNQKFYTDEEGKDIYYPIPEYELPNHDCELKYIEARGQQYIDTEYIFKNKPKIVGEIMITSRGDLDIMGNSNAKIGCFIIDFRIESNALYYRYSSTNSKIINTDINANKWYDFEFSDKVKVNGIEKDSIGSYDFSSNDQTFYIGRGRNCGCARFKEIKMYDGDILVRDLVPYYKKNINNVGMLDKLSNVFYSNKGIGDDFTAGPDVENF